MPVTIGWMIFDRRDHFQLQIERLGADEMAEGARMVAWWTLQPSQRPAHTFPLRACSCQPSLFLLKINKLW